MTQARADGNDVWPKEAQESAQLLVDATKRAKQILVDLAAENPDLWAEHLECLKIAKELRGEVTAAVQKALDERDALQGGGISVPKPKFPFSLAQTTKVTVLDEALLPPEAFGPDPKRIAALRELGPVPGVLAKVQYTIRIT